MISIRKTISELDTCTQQRDLALDCYIAALRNTAHYAVGFDDALKEPYCAHLNALAGDVTSGDAGALQESRATIRGLLRDYRDKAAHYLTALREELASTARALQEIVETVGISDDDHESRLRSAMTTLHALAEKPEGAPLKPALTIAADAIQESVAELRKQHEVTVSQFLVEIRVLHKRIDALETAASLDQLTSLFTRREIERHIRSAPPGGYCLLLIKGTGFRDAELTFNRDVAVELIGAFTRRLRNSLPEGTAIGRWAEEEFIALVQKERPDAVAMANHISEQLSGSYACLLAGKPVRPCVQLRVGVVESKGEDPELILDRAAEVLRT